MSFASACCVCDAALSPPHQHHLEDYNDPLSAFPICRRCHYAIHIRFRRPALWARFVAEVPADSWVRDLSLTRDPSDNLGATPNAPPRGAARRLESKPPDPGSTE